MSNEDKQNLKELLEKNLEVGEQSLELLKKIHRQMLYRRIFHTVKWLVIIGLVVWGFVQIQPFIDQAAETVENIQGATEDLKQLPGFQ